MRCASQPGFIEAECLPGTNEYRGRVEQMRTNLVSLVGELTQVEPGYEHLKAKKEKE